MRLLILGPGHPFRGGIARTTTDLVLALRRRGHQVEFFTPYRQYPGWLYPGVGDRDPEACPRVEGARPILAPLSPLSWAGLRRRARDVRAEAWIMPYWTWAWAPWWRFVLSGLPPDRPPAVAIAHNLADHDAGVLHRLVSLLVLGRVEGLFTHARALEGRLHTMFPRVPVGSFPLPVPEVKAVDRGAARRELGVTRSDRLALFLGLVRPYKGVEDLLEAWSRLPGASPWRLVVAGEAWGGWGRRLEELRRGLALGSRVRLNLRWIPEEEVAHLLAAADLVVLPYRSGSQSAVAPLAFAHGVPVLATPVGGLAEVVQDGVNGRIVPPGNAGAIAAALRELNDEALDLLRAGCRETASRLTWDAYAAELETVLRSVVERHGVTTPG